ncbi:MAG: hypothetical protein ACRCXE_03730, partial [Metamycoplasmataceae bacterium]
MNNKPNFSRFGDTSFRQKNQVNFYWVVFNYIYEECSKNNNIPIDNVFEYLLQQGVLNHSKGKKVGVKNRYRMVIRQ